MIQQHFFTLFDNSWDIRLASCIAAYVGPSEHFLVEDQFFLKKILTFSKVMSNCCILKNNSVYCERSKKKGMQYSLDLIDKVINLIMFENFQATVGSYLLNLSKLFVHFQSTKIRKYTYEILSTLIGLIYSKKFSCSLTNSLLSLYQTMTYESNGKWLTSENRLNISELKKFLYRNEDNLIPPEIKQKAGLEAIRRSSAKDSCTSTKETYFTIEGACEEKDIDFAEEISTTCESSRDRDISINLNVCCSASVTLEDILEKSTLDSTITVETTSYSDEPPFSIQDTFNCYEGFFVGDLTISFDPSDELICLAKGPIQEKKSKNKKNNNQLTHRQHNDYSFIDGRQNFTIALGRTFPTQISQEYQIKNNSKSHAKRVLPDYNVQKVYRTGISCNIPNPKQTFCQEKSYRLETRF